MASPARSPDNSRNHAFVPRMSLCSAAGRCSAALTRPYPPEPVRGSHPSARTAVLIQLAISIKRFPPKTFKAILA